MIILWESQKCVFWCVWDGGGGLHLYIYVYAQYMFVYTLFEEFCRGPPSSL